jgi:hypothetical protein
MKIFIFADRFTLRAQKNRERGKKTFVDVQWSEMISQIKDMKGKNWKIRNGRHLAIVKAWKVTTPKLTYYLLEGGIYTPGKKPAQWKDGDEEVKEVSLATGHEWIHPGWFVIPPNGNQLVLQSTRSGPHIGDIAWWVQKIMGCNYVDYTAVPCGKFYDGLTEKGKWKKIILDLQRKPRVLGQEDEYLESELGSDVGAGKLSLVYEATNGGWFSRLKVVQAIKRYVPGLSRKKEFPKDTDTYQLKDCTLSPEISDEATSADVLSFVKGIRRQIEIEVNSDRIIKRSQIESELGKELIDWVT